MSAGEGDADGARDDRDTAYGDAGYDANDPTEAKRRMRTGVRRWVVETAGTTRDGVRRLTPSAIVAFLAASAFAPFGVTGAAAATAGLLGNMGGAYLHGALERAAERLGRETSGDRERDENAVLLQEIHKALDAGGKEAEGIRKDIAAVLQEIGAARTAAIAAVETASADTSAQLVRMFGAMATEFAEFRFLIEDLPAALNEILGGISDVQDTQCTVVSMVAALTFEVAALREDQHRRDAEHRVDQDHRRRDSIRLVEVQEKVRTLERRTRPGEPVASGPSGLLSANGVAQEECPYQGLAPFETVHADVFYGRERDTAELLVRLRERLTGTGMLVVSGASGAGKSSLLRAGLLPALGRGTLAPGSADWPRRIITPTRAPLSELATQLALLGGQDATSVQARLEEEPQNAHLIVRRALVAADAKVAACEPLAPRRLVLVVDQFEELFTRCSDEDERRAYVTALHAAATAGTGSDDEPPALVVICVRGDFWEMCARYSQLADVLEDGQFVLGPMGRVDLEHTIAGPAAQAGLQLETGLVEIVLRDLNPDSRPTGEHDVGNLPLLSQAMLVTWENREGDILTIRGYERSGGIGQVIQTSADAVYDGLSGGEQAVAQSIFRRLTVLERNGRRSRRQATRAELQASTHGDPQVVETILAAFAEKRLIVLNEDVVDTAHDALLEAWPRLQGWLEGDQASRILYDQLVDQAKEWAANQEDSSFLYVGSRLVAVQDEVRHWAADPERHLQLGPTEQRFLDVSHRAATRRNRQRRLVVTGMAVLLLVALLAAQIAARQADNAREQRNVAIARQLIAESETLQTQDPTLAKLLAVAAWQLGPSPEARARMLGSVTNPARATIVPEATAVRSIAFSPDGEALAVVGEGVGASGPRTSFVQLWGLSDRRPTTGTYQTQRIDSDGVAVLSVAVGPEDDLVATGHEGGVVQLWDAATGSRVGEALGGHNESVSAVVFSPDGRTLATGSEDGTVRLWDVSSGTLIGGPFDSEVSSAESVAFSPDGLTLAIGQNDGSVQLWDIGSGGEAAVLLRRETSEESDDSADPNDTGVWAVEFNDEGETLTTAREDGTAQVWDVSTGTLVRDSVEPSQISTGLTAATLSSDGQILATRGLLGSIELWDVPTGTPLGRGLPFDGALPSDPLLRFSPDGRTLVTSGSRTLHVLEVNHGPRPIRAPLDGHDGEVWSLAFSPDGQTLITGSEDSRARLWDVATGELVDGPLEGHSGPIYSVAFSPDGELIATGSADTTTQLWHARTGRPALDGPLEGHENSVWSVAFSPDGQYLATGSELDPSPRLWDPATGEPIARSFSSSISDELGGVAAMAFDPDSRILASSTRLPGGARLWDISTGELIETLPAGHAARISTMAFSPDGQTLATGGSDGTIFLWDIANRSRIGDPLEGHTGRVHSVAFSQDGRFLATGSGDSTARLWDVATGEPIGDPITGHSGHGTFVTRVPSQVNSVAFSPNGRFLATGSGDSTARLWDVSFLEEDPVDLACERAGRSLTEEEWERYVPDFPFRQVC